MVEQSIMTRLYHLPLPNWHPHHICLIHHIWSHIPITPSKHNDTVNRSLKHNTLLPPNHLRIPLTIKKKTYLLPIIIVIYNLDWGQAPEVQIQKYAREGDAGIVLLTPSKSASQPNITSWTLLPLQGSTVVIQIAFHESPSQKNPSPGPKDP